MYLFGLFQFAEITHQHAQMIVLDLHLDLVLVLELILTLGLHPDLVRDLVRTFCYPQGNEFNVYT